jgi:hypothetical protein
MVYAISRNTKQLALLLGVCYVVKVVGLYLIHEEFLQYITINSVLFTVALIAVVGLFITFEIVYFAISRPVS